MSEKTQYYRTSKELKLLTWAIVLQHIANNIMQYNLKSSFKWVNKIHFVTQKLL